MPDVAGEWKTREREKKVSPKMTFACGGMQNESYGVEFVRR